MTLSFDNIGLSEERVKHLQSIGFETPTPIQVQAIPPLLEGRDVVGQAQTGTGKTAAFSLPMLERVDPNLKAVQAIILTPTRELAMQVSKAVETFIGPSRLWVTSVYGGQSIDRQIQRLRRGTQIVVGTPGRVIDLIERRELKLDQVIWSVLDEADEMLNMGFIQDVERIFSALPDSRQNTFFSATMSSQIRKLVARFLNNPVTVTVKQAEKTPSRIAQVAYILPRGCSKLQSLQPILELEDPESAIIFVRTKQAATDMTMQLQAAGFSVDEYHGNLNQAQRERLLSRFRRGNLRWVVATDIAARGIDVDHLTHVINYDLPDNLENYIHRIGRTGRAGRTGKAITILHNMERYRLRHLERHTRQTVEVKDLPKRAEVEAYRIEKLKVTVGDALAGERVASFLPLVAQMSEDYDLRAVAAAALQMVYDNECPKWQSQSHYIDDHPAPRKPNKRRSGGYRGGGGRSRGPRNTPRPRPRLASSGDRR
ncbi:MAG: DEAD/DEAH box helicase [Cyanobacteria bacterium P01_C01_bin.89]